MSDRLLAGASIATGGVAAAAWAVRGRSSQVFGPSAWRGNTRRNAIALTFDDGPSPGTEQILRILAGYRVPATFFQCGMNVLRSPELSYAARSQGHELGNHSHSHPNFAFARPSDIRHEFARAQEAIAQAAGIAPTIMRPPYGVRWFGFRQMQAELGLRGVMWTVIGRDWKLAARDIAARVLANAGNGSIICLHDGRGISPKPDTSQTVEAVRLIVPSLLNAGYHLQTVSELLCPTN